jgi:DtxR family Mn-dependent transcriptional regulator
MSSMDALSESAEMMIKNINELASSGERVRTSDLSTKTELKPASVTEMIQRLGDLGLVDYEPYHGVHLTKQGQHVADVIEHRFNILERFLTEILGVDGTEASEVACRMEHVLTRDVEHKLTTFLGVDPQKESELFCHKINIESDVEHKYLPLSNFREGKTGIVKLIFESNELANILEKKGIIPGSSLLLKESNNKVYTIQNEEGEFSIDRETASKIIVQNT